MARLIRTLVVDDEPVAREGVKRLLQHDPDVVIVGEAGSGAEAVRLIHELKPDLLFLDIQMPELNGFDVLAAVGAEHIPVTVFVTAHDQFALQAFEVQALDYLLKPFDDDRFHVVLARAKRQCLLAADASLEDRLHSLLTAYGSASAGTWATRIVVKHGGTVFFQPVEDIDWIEAADYFAKLHVGKQVHMVSETLASLEQRLDPSLFMRVHRSAIVNLSRIRELRLDYQNRHYIVLHNGARVPLSRARKERLEAVLA